MKKILIYLIVITMLLLSFSACNKMSDTEFNDMHDEFNKLFELIYDKEVSRINRVLETNKQKNEDIEVNAIISSMEKTLKNKNVESDYNNEYQAMINILEEIITAERIITTNIDEIDKLEYCLVKIQEYNDTYITEFSVSSSITSNYLDSIGITDDKFSEFMKDKSVYLTNSDIQYNMENNLDKSFAIAGKIELDDYYNYGFDDDMESSYFCVRMRPYNNDSYWYLYLNRNDFKSLYNDLQKEDKISAYMVCVIPSYRYKKNQGNMALVKSVKWY